MRSKTGAALVLALALGAVSWTVDGEIAYGGILRQFERTPICWILATRRNDSTKMCHTSLLPFLTNRAASADRIV